MVKRETYPVYIECPCGNSGNVIYEENQNPVHHDGELNERIISIPENFVTKEGKIYCGVCGKEISD